MTENISKHIAKRIIHDLGATGQPPIYGYQFFTVGLEQYIETIDDEYLKDYIKEGGNSFKLVVGTYGGGKTHFLYTMQGRAWDSNYITSYIELSPHSTPFHKLEQVYKSIVASIMYPQDSEALLQETDKGIEALLKNWYYEKRNELSNNFSGDDLKFELSDYVSNIGPYESKSFQNAIKSAFLALNNDDDESFEIIVQWLNGENPPKIMLKEFKIFEKIDKSTAFKMMRCLIKWVWEINYSGLIILMDEAEQSTSMSTKQKNAMLQNLRELIDACSRGTLHGTMVFYAVPDESFLEGRTNVYEALNQRLATVFENELNPTGVKIDLENISNEPIEMLNKMGIKLAEIYELAYEIKFAEEDIKDRIQEIAQNAYDERHGEIGYKRNFVQKIMPAFHEMRSKANY